MSWIEAGTFLKDWREDKGLTQDAFRAMAKVSTSTVSRIENGKGEPIEDKTLTKVAKAMGAAGSRFFEMAGRDDLADRVRVGEEGDLDLPAVLKAAIKLTPEDRAELIRDLLGVMSSGK